MKRVLIVGKNSYIGENFAEHCKNDYEIDTVDARDNHWEEVDFSKYDTVFHVAGIAHVKETKQNAMSYYLINRDLAVEVATYAKKQGVKQFVFLSTMAVYGLVKGTITSETALTPRTNYGKSKLQAEEKLKELQDENFKVAIIRPPMVYGKNCKGNFPRLLRFSDKLSFFPKISNERSMIYITNLCEFVKLTVQNNAGGIMFPQNSEYICVSNLIKLYKEYSNKKCNLTKLFNFAVYMLSGLSAMKKIFGTLIYDKKLSATFENSYNVVDFETSLKECLGDK